MRTLRSTDEWWWVLGGAGLSAAGCVFILFSYCTFPRLRRFPFNLIVHMSLANCLQLSSFLLLMHHSRGMCIASGVMMTYFHLVASSFTALMSYVVYRLVAMDSAQEGAFNTPLLCSLAWGLPVLFVLPSAVSGSYRVTTTGWCFIPPKSFKLRLMCYYVPSALIVLFDIAMLAMTLFPRGGRRASHPAHPGESRMLVAGNLQHNRRRAKARLALYVYVFIFFRAWEFADRAYEYEGHDEVTEWTKIHAVATVLEGFVNAIVYGTTKRLIDEYRRVCCASHVRWTHRSDSTTGSTA